MKEVLQLFFIFYADHYFIDLCAEFLNRQIVIYPVHPEQGWQDGKMTVNPISRKQTDKSEPLYFLYYSDLVFTKDSIHSTNESGINHDLRENTLQSAGELSNISIYSYLAIPSHKVSFRITVNDFPRTLAFLWH